MSNTIDPVELEFLLKSTNFKAEAEKMKSEIAGVGDNAQKAAEKVTNNLGRSLADANNQFKRSAPDISQYSRSLNSLSFSMQQVARELPSLAMSPQMFFLAISNNLPIMADNVKRVREENKLLAASGQASTPVWKQLASSLFSWQTALVAGITILTVYGKDIVNFVGNLFKARTEIKLTKDEVNGLNESFAKAAGSDLGKLQVLFDKLQSAQKGTSEYYKAKKDILDQYGDYLAGMDKEIISLENQRGAYEALTTSIYAAAKAKALQNTYAELGQQRLEKENEQLKIIRDEFMSKYPGNLGEFKFNQFKQELEAGKGFSFDIKSFIDSFDKEELRNSGRAIGTSLSGSVQYELQKVKVNPVQDAIKGITQAQTDFNAKVKEAATLMENAVGSKRQSQIVTTKQLLESQLSEAKLMPDGPDKNKQIEKIQKQLKELEQAGTANAIKTLEQQIGELQNKMLTADEKDLKFLAAKLLLLQKQLELRKELIKSAEMSAWGTQFDGQSMAPIAAKGISPILQKGETSTNAKGQLIEITAVDKTGPTLKKVGLETEKLNKKQKDAIKDAGKLQDDLDKEDLKRKEEKQQQILDYSRQFTSELINQLGLTEDQNKELQGLADTIYNLAKGDLIGAGFSAASTVLTALFSGAGKDDTAAKSLERINQLLEHQSAILANLSGSNYFDLAAKQYDAYGKSIESTMASLTKRTSTNWIVSQIDIDNLQKLTDSLFKASARVKIDRDNFQKYAMQVSYYSSSHMPKDYSGYTAQQFIDEYTKGSLVLDQQQIEWVESIVKLQKQRAELLQDTFRQAMGFDASNVSDSIIQGIEEGLQLASDNSLGGFAKSFGELVKQALVKNITEALNLKLTEGFMTEFTSFLSADSAGGTALTPEELAKLESSYASAVGDSTAAMAALQPILAKYGVDITNSSSALTGISASVTEDTMSAFIGLMTAVRIDIKSILVSMAAEAADMGQLVGYAKTIAENTSHNFRLKAIEEGIANTNRILNDKLG